MSAVALASIELFQATREQKYADKAVELTNPIVSYQQQTKLDAVALHADYLVAVARYRQRSNLLPAGIYELSSDPEQVSKGAKLTEEHYRRHFPPWRDIWVRPFSRWLFILADLVGRSQP